MEEVKKDAKKRRPKKDVPLEFRVHYLVFVQPIGGGPMRRLQRFATSRQALKWIQQSGELIKDAYSAVEIVQCRRKQWIDVR